MSSDKYSFFNNIIKTQNQHIVLSVLKEKNIEFKTNNDKGLDPKINYSCQIFLNKKFIAKAREISKKKAEEKVAKKVYHILKLKPSLKININE